MGLVSQFLSFDCGGSHCARSCCFCCRITDRLQLDMSWLTLLDRYIAVRPDVESGTAGWGAKGKIKLSDVLKLKRPETENS